MTNQDAIKRIKEHIAIHKYRELHAIHIVEALEMAISALKEWDVPDINIGDTVYRQQAIDSLCEYYCGGRNDCKRYPKCEYLKAIQQLSPAQTEQPEREKGKWITHEEPEKENCYYIKCSVCGKEAIWTNRKSFYPPNFCPNCGADMRGEQDED